MWVLYRSVVELYLDSDERQQECKERDDGADNVGCLLVLGNRDHNAHNDCPDPWGDLNIDQSNAEL